MIRTNRWFVNWLLMLALLAQALPAAGQDKIIKKPVGDIKPGVAAEAFVEVATPRPLGDEVTINWKAGAPEGVTIKGFDVALEINFSNGQSQRLNRSVGGNQRSATFSINIPQPVKANDAPPKGFGVSKPKPPNGANSGGNSAEIDVRLCEQKCFKVSKDTKAITQCQADCRKNAGAQAGGGKGDFKKGEATPRRFGEGSISGGGKGGATADNGGKGGATADNGGKGTGGGKGGGGFDRPVAPDPITIKNLRATVTGKFSGGADAAAFREFVPPADKTTGELTPKAARNRGADNLALQVNKLARVSEIAQRARECPPGQDCFELLAQARGNGQFKISLEAVYKNGQRRTASRAAGNLSRLIPLNVDKPSGVELSSVLVNIIAEAANDFTKTDTAGVAILTPTGPIKK